MERDWQRALEGTFDLIVVGGGINGTGAARDAARRGLSVCLLERNDFGYGTTGRSTRLIHGGLRYLAQYDFGLVRESLRERELLLENAPHLVRAIPFLIPFYDGMSPGPRRLRMGLTLYDMLSYDRSVPGHRIISRDEVLQLEPSLDPRGLSGGAVYYDAQVSFVERLCLENALDAIAHGAVVLNHAEVAAFAREPTGPLTGVLARDRLSGAEGTIRGRVVLDATGPWLGRLPGTGEARIRMTKGVHLITPRVTDHAVLLFANDGRVFFSIPWFDASLTGTTDTDYKEDVDSVHATAEDVAYLQGSTRRYFPKAPIDEVAYATAGIRALISMEGVSESEVSRRHLILDHGKHGGPANLVSIVGGKITPFRDVTEEAVDVVMRQLEARKRASDTKHAPLPGGELPEGVPFAQYREEAVAKGAARTGLPKETVAHLVDVYGVRHTGVLDRIERDASLARPLCAHGRDVWAQVAFAVEEELARSTADVLLRRIPAGYGLCQALDAAPEVSRYLATRFGWSLEAQAADEAAYRAEVGLRERFRGG